MSFNNDNGERRHANFFKAERQAHFVKNVRNAYLDSGRSSKDKERAHMEAYRRLCAKEGIQSKRLEEYDRTREEATAKLSEELTNVDYDQSLTNTAKKKRKYNLKRRFAATTVTALMERKEERYSAVTQAEKIQQKTQEVRESEKRERQEREETKKKRICARKARTALYTKRTKLGQPVLSSRVQSLLQKLQEQHP